MGERGIKNSPKNSDVFYGRPLSQQDISKFTVCYVGIIFLPKIHRPRLKYCDLINKSKTSFVFLLDLRYLAGHIWPQDRRGRGWLRQWWVTLSPILTLQSPPLGFPPWLWEPQPEKQSKNKD